MAPSAILYLDKIQIIPKIEYGFEISAGVTQSTLSSLDRVQTFTRSCAGDLFSALQPFFLTDAML